MAHEKENAGGWTPNPALSMVEKTPLDERIAAERPELTAGLARLKEILGADNYEKRISPLVNLTRSGGMLLVVAPSFMERSLLERDCIAALKEAFGVAAVRVVV